MTKSKKNKSSKTQEQASSEKRGKENLMTIQEYKSIQRDVMTTLRAKSDSAPRCRVAPGNAPTESFSEVWTFLHSNEGLGYHILRGYKLFTLVRNTKSECICFVAKPHAVVLNTETGKLRCLVQNPHNLKNEFIFVPSSLMHKELSDKELCSGNFMLCDVIGGDAGVVSDITAISTAMSRFEKRRLTTRPGQMPSPPAIYVRYLPAFLEWFQSKNRTLPESLLTDISLSFGMSFRPNLSNDQIDGCRQVSLFNEEVDVTELVRPQKPFQFEEDVWLPSVPLLHEFYNLVLTLTLTPEDQIPLYSKIYDSLQNEYWCRLQTIGKRSSEENKARVYGQWQ